MIDYMEYCMVFARLRVCNNKKSRKKTNIVSSCSTNCIVVYAEYDYASNVDIY